MSIRVTRRQLLAAAGGAILASFALPPSLRKILGAAAPAPVRGARMRPLSGIQHVVVVMQENRSFDHYFGTMPGVRGFADPAVPKSLFYQPDPANPDKYLLPFHTDTTSTRAQALPSTSHSWGSQHQSWNNGAMDGFVTAHLAADGMAVGRAAGAEVRAATHPGGEPDVPGAAAGAPGLIPAASLPRRDVAGHGLTTPGHPARFGHDQAGTGVQ